MPQIEKENVSDEDLILLSHAAGMNDSDGNTVYTSNKLQIGDLLFFNGINSTSSNKVSHVGIYIGNGEFLHAANSSRGVVIDDLDADYYKKHYVTARRVIR